MERRRKEWREKRQERMQKARKERRKKKWKGREKDVMEEKRKK